jgi:triphosphoribosyl-dephospho-CoA synthase
VIPGAWPELSRTPDDIALAAQAACLFEVSAPKPGNVNRRADFADAGFEDFLLSAAAIGPAIGRAGQDALGRVISNAVSSTARLAGSNTNLGMVLLLAPLAQACLAPGDPRRNLDRLLSATTVEDARLVYAAVRLARPGGLGRVLDADVAEEPHITLRDAMVLAQDRDAIAREYATGFALTFDIAYPALVQACRDTPRRDQAIVQAFLALLAQVPDTLIARKRGREVAAGVSREAGEVLQRGGVLTEEGRSALADFDRALRDDRHTLNPGTTADLIAAAIFLHLLRIT